MGFSRRFPNIAAPLRRPLTIAEPYPARLPAHLANSLVDPRFDQESCGVGFVAHLSGEPSRTILDHALTALSRLEHRGAVAADGKSSDGVGVTTAVPRAWLLAQAGVDLSSSSPFGVAVVFLPEEDKEQRERIESALASQECKILVWRAVPVRPEVLGEIANAARPVIWHILITSESATDFDRRLFLARKQFEASSLRVTSSASRREPWSTRRCAPDA
jgi:glutamate synthase (NADPH/NADH) large chain